ADVVAQLRNRSVEQLELPLLEECAKTWVLAREQAGRGEFALALQTIERVCRLMPGRMAALGQFITGLEQKHQNFASLLVQLHEATDQRDWREVVRLAEQVLALAPQHPEARRARALAWRAIQPATIAEPAAVGARSGDRAPTGVRPPDQRFLLWI